MIRRILKGAGIRSSYGTMGASGVVLVEDGKNVLVDVGHFGNRDALIGEMKKAEISFSDIDTVVLTHLNWDHCLNVDLFPNAEILVGKDEFDRGTLFGIHDGITPFFKIMSHSLCI